MHITESVDVLTRSRKELAHLINQVQRHPLTPPKLKESIRSTLFEALEAADLDGSAEGIEIFLTAHERLDRRTATPI